MLTALSQVNPRFGWYTYLAESAMAVIAYGLSDISFKKTYCV